MKFGGSQVFKELYSCQWTPIFSILQIFFKVEAAFPYSGNLFFNILHPASANGFSFCPAETVFFGQCSFTASTNHYGIRRKQFWEKELIFASGQLIFWVVEIFFFSIFQKLLLVLVYFPSSGSVFFNEILHSDQWKEIFWLVETVFFCLEDFPSIGNCHLN